MLDIFNDDAFTVHSLTETINVAPYQPKRLGAMGIFETKNPTTNTVLLERQGDIISLIPSKRRGSGQTTKKPRNPRDVRPVLIPHVPYDDEVLASDLPGVRAYGTEDDVLDTVVSVVNDRLEEMRRDHEATHEWLRVGAIKGIIVDGDGTTVLANLFTEFGLTQLVVYFNLAAAAPGTIKTKCIQVIEAIEDVLGGTTYDYIHCFCGKDFYNLLTQHPDVSDAYAEQTGYVYPTVTQGQGTMGRGTSQIEFGDITFEQYRGKIGSVNFIAPDAAHFFPVGVPGLFQQHFGPANTISAVNKPGRVLYAMQHEMKWEEGVELHTESNPLMICKRPSLLVLGDKDAS